jgi:hypothetical protein
LLADVFHMTARTVEVVTPVEIDWCHGRATWLYASQLMSSRFRRRRQDKRGRMTEHRATHLACGGQPIGAIDKPQLLEPAGMLFVGWFGKRNVP